ncbi:MAG: hypothetical protein FJ316_11325 [SAR202 cluster bacterium]|nr:hypothetical protein [SAR202 cluster bacterium]
MAGKGRRVASRQAELNRRRRRHVPAGGHPSSGVAVQDRLEGSAPAGTPAGTAQAALRPASAAPAAHPGPASRARGEASSIYSYVGPEMRRIALLMGAVILILVILSFILK